MSFDIACGDSGSKSSLGGGLYRSSVGGLLSVAAKSQRVGGAPVNLLAIDVFGATPVIDSMDHQDRIGGCGWSRNQEWVSCLSARLQLGLLQSGRFGCSGRGFVVMARVGAYEAKAKARGRVVNGMKSSGE